MAGPRFRRRRLGPVPHGLHPKQGPPRPGSRGLARIGDIQDLRPQILYVPSTLSPLHVGHGVESSSLQAFFWK